jgi:MarR family transcriptional regulator, 2-MHQ and catechol-resistance regulon repressor
MDTFCPQVRQNHQMAKETLQYEKPKFVPVLRELVTVVQRFEKFSADHIHTLGYTAPQFDIIATLGNTDGMTFKELGKKTLITKGTLTGVVDRLEAKGLVKRIAVAEDARKTIVRLTSKGEKEFIRVFPAHLEYCRVVFDRLCPMTLSRLGHDARELRDAFEGIICESESV